MLPCRAGATRPALELGGGRPNVLRTLTERRCAMSGRQLVGVWDFTSMVFRTPSGGVVYPYGEHLLGRLSYTSGGYMSVLLMRPDRPVFPSDDPLGGTESEKAAAFESFDAYCGTYEVDERMGAVVHCIELSKFPNWVGTRQVREYALSGDQLVLRATLAVGGEQWHGEASLQRIRGE